MGGITGAHQVQFVGELAPLLRNKRSDCRKDQKDEMKMSAGVIYRTDLAEVDWVALKTTLTQDQFDNGRSPEQLRTSFANSRAVVLAWSAGTVVGTVRALSDGVCNAYVVDVWTLSRFRRQGIGHRMMELLLAQLPGQHVYLFTDDAQPFYRKLGFEPQDTGMGCVVGEWLEPPVHAVSTPVAGHSDSREVLLVRLSETIEWCSSRTDVSAPATCLRSLELSPNPLAGSPAEVVLSVACHRQVALRWPRLPPPADLAGGRLLAFAPSDSLSDGCAEQETGGFLNTENAPPWDTWIGVIREITGREYLLSWIPPAFVELVSLGIEVNPEECIWWIDADLQLLGTGFGT